MDDKTKSELEFIINYPHLDNLITFIRQHHYLPPTKTTTFPLDDEKE